MPRGKARFQYVPDGQFPACPVGMFGLIDSLQTPEQGAHTVLRTPPSPSVTEYYYVPDTGCLGYVDRNMPQVSSLWKCPWRLWSCDGNEVIVTTPPMQCQGLIQPRRGPWLPRKVIARLTRRMTQPQTYGLGAREMHQKVGETQSRLWLRVFPLLGCLTKRHVHMYVLAVS